MPPVDRTFLSLIRERGFEDIGPALRFLRQQSAEPKLKQNDLAERADVTKGMLSSYETGKQKPTLDSLARILPALGADLVHLQGAMIVVGRLQGSEDLPEPSNETRSPFAPGRWSSVATVAEPETPYGEPAEPDPATRTVEVPRPLDAEEERLLGECLLSFHLLIRALREKRTDATDARPESPDKGRQEA